MPGRRSELWVVVATAAGIAYPLMVYWGIGHLSPGVFVVLGIGLLALRFARSRQGVDAGRWAVAFGLAAVSLAVSFVISPEYAMKVYPVAVSLAVAGVFGWSLVFPPTVVERLARLGGGEFPPDGVVYTRNVTLLWVCILVANAMVSTATGIWGSLETWTLWNGLVSYLVMGAVFLGEFGYRKFLRRRTACSGSRSPAC